MGWQNSNKMPAACLGMSNYWFGSQPLKEHSIECNLMREYILATFAQTWKLTELPKLRGRKSYFGTTLISLNYENY